MLTSPRPHSEIDLFRDVADEQWADWKWQLKNRITSVEQLARVIHVCEDEGEALRKGIAFRFGITPHYASLIDPEDPRCPMRRQVVPSTAEMYVAPEEMADSLGEDSHSPAPNVTHRYPDRVLFLLTHECSLYCRYCTRRRIVGDQVSPSNADLDAGVAYIQRTPAIRDVLISGGDPLAVTDSRLEYLLSRLRAIPHVEIIRIGTRMPVVLPQRLDVSLLEMLRKYHPLWLNTHFNHPFELSSPSTRQCMNRIADAGIPTGNQTVLLKGINDCPVIMRRLMHELLKVRCRPYYIYNCDLSEVLKQEYRLLDPFRGIRLVLAFQHSSLMHRGVVERFQ